MAASEHVTEITLSYDNSEGLKYDAAIQHLIIGRATWVASGCDIPFGEGGARDVQLEVTDPHPLMLAEELRDVIGPDDLICLDVRDV